MSWLDTIHAGLQGYAVNTNENLDVGQVNEITPEQLRTRRNMQLVGSIIIIAAIASLFYFSNPQKK